MVPAPGLPEVLTMIGRLKESLALGFCARTS